MCNMKIIPYADKTKRKTKKLIATGFLPAITGGIEHSVEERMLLTLHAKLGGLGVPYFIYQI